MTTVAGRRRISETRVRAAHRDPAPASDSPLLEPARNAEVLTDAHEVVPVAEGGEPAKPGRGRRWSRRPRPLTVALTICLVAVLLAAAVCATTVRRDRTNVAAGNAALAAARTSAVTILSYDYRHLDADFAAATALTTGSLRTDYQATTSKAVAQLAAQTHAVVSAKVMAGGVVRSTSTTATVLLFVDQTTTSNRLSTAQTDQNRVELTLHRSGTHWLVSGLKAL
jgi:Mce-associated membrane protein